MITLTKTQKARVKWLTEFGCRLGADFEVSEEGLFIYAADEYVAWQELAKKEVRQEIEEMVRVFGVGKPLEYDAETLSALNEDQILGMVNDHIGSAGEDTEIMEEVVVAQLEATIEPMIKALEEEEAVMEPAAEVEEMAFVITAQGVALSKAFRKAIAVRAKNYFETFDAGTDVAGRIQEDCLAAWGEITRTRQRGAFAAYRYARAVVRSLEAQTRNGGGLRVNSYWA